MAKHTEEEIIKYIKDNMVNEEGIIYIDKSVDAWIYDYLRYRYKDPQERVDWVREKTGALLSIRGFNYDDVIKQRLRANNLIKIEKVNGKLVERLYTSDIRIPIDENATIEERLKAERINKIYSSIKDMARNNNLTISDYVAEKLGLEYVSRVMFTSIDSVRDWIVENMQGQTDANILRKLPDFVRVREYLEENWKIQNAMYESAFVDYMRLNFPEYKINASLNIEKITKKDYYFNILITKYPDRVVRKLKKDHPRIYDQIKRFKAVTPDAIAMDLKEFIEDYIGGGMLKYVTTAKKVKSKWTLRYIKERMERVFGEGNVEDPVVVQLRKNDRQLEKQIGIYCQRNEIEDKNELLLPWGYRVENTKQLGSVKRDNSVVNMMSDTLERNGR